jgi:hypothetical protein
MDDLRFRDREAFFHFLLESVIITISVENIFYW